MSNFKAGDLVYYPPHSNKVLTIHQHDNSVYPITIGLGSRLTYTFTIDGKFHTGDVLPSIYYATSEMKAKLEDFYGVEFEEPSAKQSQNY